MPKLKQDLDADISTIRAEQIEDITNIREYLGLDVRETMRILLASPLAGTFFGSQVSAPFERFQDLKMLSEAQGAAAVKFLEEYDPDEDDHEPRFVAEAEED